MNTSGMRSHRVLVGALVSAVLTSGSLTAQSRVPAAQPLDSRPVPAGADLSNLSPFTLDNGNRPGFHLIPASAMSQQDRELLARSEPALHREAAFLDIDFNRGDLTQAQLACPSFPDHLLLRFELHNGKGDVSAFSASIPRDNGGTVRVLPVLRRGYTLFSPAPRNEQTIGIFNRLLREEKSATQPDWVSLATCYAAFASQDMELASAPPVWRTASDPLLQLDANGRASIHLVTLDPRPHSWEMDFAPNGRLL